MGCQVHREDLAAALGSVNWGQETRVFGHDAGRRLSYRVFRGGGRGGGQERGCHGDLGWPWRGDIVAETKLLRLEEAQNVEAELEDLLAAVHAVDQHVAG